MSDSKRYNSMEEILKSINGRFVSLNEMEIKRNNKILNDVLEPLVRRMRDIDNLFDRLYNSMFFGGSYYDGLKVGSPNEYDIDLLLKFPSSVQPEILISTTPSFVHVDLTNKTGFEKLCAESWKKYLDTQKVLSWMEGLITRALKDFKIYSSNFSDINLEIKVRKGGPAFTLVLDGYGDEEPVNISIDLVPCFSFDGTNWPTNGFKKNPDPVLPNFFIVPKKPKSVKSNATSYWRLSFQMQERPLINGKNRLKPALRLLKKMRDTLGHDVISSYYLKTVVMWEANDQESNFWNSNSLSYVFMHILKKYRDALSMQKIRYFWYKKYNLLQDIIDDNQSNIENKTDTLSNFEYRLSSIIKKIERNLPHNPKVVTEYLLTQEEYDDIFPDEVEYEPPTVTQEKDEAIHPGLVVGLAMVPVVIGGLWALGNIISSNRNGAGSGRRPDSR